MYYHIMMRCICWVQYVEGPYARERRSLATLQLEVTRGQPDGLPAAAVGECGPGRVF